MTEKDNKPKDPPPEKTRPPDPVRDVKSGDPSKRRERRINDDD